jgi:hypothetical protein
MRRHFDKRKEEQASTRGSLLYKNSNIQSHEDDCGANSPNFLVYIKHTCTLDNGQCV